MSTFEDELRAGILAIGSDATSADLVERSLRTARALRRRRSAAAASAVAVAVAVIAVGGWALGASRHDGPIQQIGTPTPTSVPPAPASPAPTSGAASALTAGPDTASSVDIVYCPTTSGIATPSPTKPSAPLQDIVTMPSALVGKVQEYREYPNPYGTNQQGQPVQWALLGPSGWKCVALIAADGSSGLTVAPQISDPLLPLPPGAPYIGSGDTGRSQTQGDLGACPFFLPLSTGHGFGDAQDPPCSVPAGEVQEKIDAHTIALADPPNASTTFWKLAVARYVAGQDTSSMECALPADLRDICALALGSAGAAATDAARSAEAAQQRAGYRVPMLSGAPATYTIAGTGCVPQATVNVAAHAGSQTQPLTTTPADPDGSFSIRVAIPVMKAPTVDLIATCAAPNSQETVQVDVALRYVPMASAASPAI
jgi:hypothetical protein